MISRVAVLLVSLGVHVLDLIQGVSRRAVGRPFGVVLYYHAVTDEQTHRFAAQMDQVVTRATPYRAGRPETMNRHGLSVAVTFDDAFKSVLENAQPVLEQRGIPFTMFAPTGCMGERPSWVRDAGHPSWRERVMTADELAELAQSPLAEIGSHSVNHPNFLEISAVSADDELRRSRAELETIVGKRIQLFSFPHGKHDAAAVERALRAGYSRVFTIDPLLDGPNASTSVIGRTAVSPDDWPLEFRLKMHGAYRWRASIRRRSR